MRAGLCRLGVLAAAVVVCSLVLCAGAVAANIEVHGATIVERFVVRSDQGGGCSFDIFVDVPSLPGVTKYTAFVTDTVKGATAAFPDGYSIEPPYEQDHIVFGPGVGFQAPAGEHQIPLAGGGGGIGVHGAGCPDTGEPGRFGLVRVIGERGSGCAAQVRADLHYKTGETIIPYTVSDITHDCQRMTLLAPGGFVRAIPNGSPRQTGRIVLHRRACGPLGVTLRTSEGPQNIVLGHDSIGKVLFADGDATGPEGERLRTGDLLCADENGAVLTGPAGDVESRLRLHVGPGGALWALPYERSFPEHSDFGIIDVHDTIVKLQGAIRARQVVLGLGHGRTVTLHPPVGGANTLLFRPGHIPFDYYKEELFNQGTFSPFEFGRGPARGPENLDGFIYLIASPNFVFDGPVLCTAEADPAHLHPDIPTYPLVGANGRLEFREGLHGSGQFVAWNDITLRGPIDFRGDEEDRAWAAFFSLGSVKLLGIG